MTPRTEGSSAAPKRRLLTLPEVMEMTGLSKSTIYNLIERGLFPQPRRASKRAARWLSDEVDGWMDDLPRATIRNLG